MMSYTTGLKSKPLPQIFIVQDFRTIVFIRNILADVSSGLLQEFLEKNHTE